MKDVAIRVENLGKRYTLGRTMQNARYRTLRDTLTESVRSLARVRKVTDTEDFWALRDVAFEIAQGEVVGIIGRNGAGKSTLLKILSRITEPTTGKVRIAGRVASLLEVGTGFHPELTGRENIFLNGAILGMSRVEIKSKFDEIVAFAEIDRFLDTPVKRYSSGMYVRLAFAVAAHLEPEILVIDEVLAVGDAEFQKKCLGKMEEVSRGGRTVLFVSHQTGAVAGLCSRAILLDQGRLVLSGPSRDVIAQYLGQFSDHLQTGFEREPQDTKKEIAIIRAQTLNERGEPAGLFTHNDAITVSIICKINSWLSGAEIRLLVRDFAGRTVFTTDAEIASELSGSPFFEARAVIPGNFLRPHKYIFTLVTFIPDLVIIDTVPDAFAITVVDGGSKWAKSEGLDYGCVFADCAWILRSTSRLESAHASKN